MRHDAIDAAEAALNPSDDASDWCCCSHPKPVFESCRAHWRCRNPKSQGISAMLRESGLLLDRRDGKWIHYRLSPHMQAGPRRLLSRLIISVGQNR